MSRPKIQRQGRKLCISYESSRRLNTSKVYPVKSSNGSTAIVSGTDTGLRITWTGGRSLFVASQREAVLTNGLHKPLVATEANQYPDSEDEALFDSDEEELDEDQPYPSLVQEVDIALGSPVLHLSVPAIANNQQSAGVPEILYDHIVVAVACENCSASVIAIPLDPPSITAKRKGKLGVQTVHLDAGSDFDLPTGIALTCGSEEHSGDERYDLRHANEQTRLDGCLTVALATSAHSGVLHLYSLPVVSADGRRRIYAKGTVHPAISEYLEAPAASIAFSMLMKASHEQTKLLTSTIRGSISVYDVGFLPHSLAVPSKEISGGSAALQEKLRLSTPYDSSKPLVSAGQTLRKKVLSANWALSGEAILVLLEDGHVGLFAITADAPSSLQAPPKPYTFACETYIGDAPEHAASGANPRARKPQLAPMTPNTRRTKSGALFAEPASAPSSASRGGMAVLPATASETADDAVLLWYNSNLFSIPSLRTFWAQSDRSDGLQGGLNGTRSAIIPLETPELNNENIVSVAILPTTSGASSRGLFGTTMAATHDVLVTAEYKSIILSHVQAPASAQLFSHDDASPSRSIDNRRLGRLELGLDGVDRMLDDMVTSHETVGRRVGFTEA